MPGMSNHLMSAKSQSFFTALEARYLSGPTLAPLAAAEDQMHADRI